MPSLHDLQQNFMRFLQSQGDEVASLVVGDETLDAATRLEIYRNAYSIRLKKAIETDYPVLGSYLGDDLFERMADGYIAMCPSAYTSLRDFGESLPHYLGSTRPFSDNPIIAEIARFEGQLLCAFDAADAPCAAVEELRAIQPENWPEMQVELHPSACSFTARWNSVESWQALKDGRTPPLAESGQQHWIIWRGADRLTQFRSLSTEGEAIFAGIKRGGTFAEICELVLEIVPEEQVSSVAVTHLLQWLEAGIVSSLAARH